MFLNFFRSYFNNFKGFTAQVWILALVTFINRAGTIVLPFLSKYLKEDLGFKYEEVGWIMVFYGLGSLLGSYLGGKLSDSIGFYKVMIFSLFTSGIFFILFQNITSFWGLCAGMFVLLTVADMFRPAMFVSLGTYATPETRARSFSLVRLAVNLGFATGPAVGGYIIMTSGYNTIFWVDGLSCIFAITIFAIFIKEKKKVVDVKIALLNESKKQTVFNDSIFMVFLFVCFITAILFFQIFSTLPLYHSEKFGWSELQSGLLLTMNGLIIFVLEMPMVGYFEKHKTSAIKILLWGSVLMSISFFVLLLDFWSGFLVIGMVFMTIGEMFIFPFSNAFALSRAPKNQEGKYMAFFTMSFSLAHICSSKIGMQLISKVSYNFNWIVMGSTGLLAVFGCFYILKKLRLSYKI